jgi:hypothetical protein
MLSSSTPIARKKRETVKAEPASFDDHGPRIDVSLYANLLVAEYLVAVSNFMLATMGALVVGKAVLVATKCHC